MTKKFFLLVALLMGGVAAVGAKNGLKPMLVEGKAFRAPADIVLTDAEKQLVEKNNSFAYNLFLKTRKEESMILSPLSITYALGMLNNGAVGKTQQEICQVLGFDDVEALNDFCLKINDGLKTAGYEDTTTKTLISNTIFVNQGQGWELKDDFKYKASHYYNANPDARDFYDGVTRDVINQWASDHTEGMIKEVLKEEEFDPSFVSYLLNAIYFKGMWSEPFKTEDTQEEVFNGVKAVPMMHKQHTETAYAENELFQTVLLPYGNGTYRMQVFLPREGKTVDEVVESLRESSQELSLREYDVDLKLPRFEISTNQDLVEVMSDLGMPTAFSPAEADFSNLCADNHGQNIYIGLMKQVAKIKLDEQGTEAAAVTIIGEKATGMPKEAKFHATRPFFYTISEQSTGIILFMGQYTGDALTAAVQQPVLSSGEWGRGSAIYNLNGQRLGNPPAQGLYIQNGKKVYR